MITVLLLLHLFVTVALIGTILIQRSEEAVLESEVPRGWDRSCRDVAPRRC